MSEDQNRSGGGRRRRRRRKGGGGGSNNNRSNNNSNRSSNRGNSGGNQRRNNSRTPKEKLGGREPVDASGAIQEGPLHLSALELFCTYYLGLTPSNGSKKPNVRDVARFFDRSVNEIDKALVECGMDKATLKNVDFDFSLAQLDVRVAPDGIDKRELARPLFDEFVEANESFVDWAEPKIDYDSSDASDSEEE